MKQTILQKMTDVLTTVGFAVAAIAAALLIGGAFVAVMGYDVGLSMSMLIQGAVGSVSAISETFVKATPLIFTGLSYAMARRCGVVNLGIEGQVYMGGLLGTVAAIYLAGLPAPLHILLSVAAAFVGGGVLGALVMFLKNRFGATELITTIMFNYIAMYLVDLLVNGPLKDPAGTDAQSVMVPQSAQLPRLISGTRFHLGIVLAVLCVLFYHFFLSRTKQGYEIRVVGSNLTAAEYAGIHTQSRALLAMFIAGGFGGLAGGVEILATQLRLFPNFSNNYGWDGIAVALLGNGSAGGIIPSALLFGALRSGATRMQMKAHTPAAVISVIQAIIILLVVGKSLLVKLNRQRKLKKAGG